MTTSTTPANGPEFKMSDKTCPRTIDTIGSTGREDRLGEICGELMMAPMPKGEAGDDTYYCERCGCDIQFSEVK